MEATPESDKPDEQNKDTGSAPEKEDSKPEESKSESTEAPTDESAPASQSSTPETRKGGGSKAKGSKGKKSADQDPDPMNSLPERLDGKEAEAKASEDKSTETKAAEPAAKEEKRAEKLQQQHVSRILDAVLEEPEQEDAGHHGFKHPLFLDIILAAGLLVAMAGFSIGMFKIYVTHSAKQSINQQNYHAAIVLLKGTPLPGFFNIAGSEDSVELLNRALYLDAISKLEISRDDESALDELEQIRPGSGYFELAQDLLRDNTRPSKLQLEGNASHDASPTDPEIKEQKPIVPDEDIKDASP